MDIKQLPSIVLLLVFTSLLIGVGAIVLISLGDSARTTAIAANETKQFTMNGTGTALTNTQVASFTELRNKTTAFTPVTDYNVTIGADETRVKVSSTLDGRSLNATYVYYVDSTTTTQMDNVVTAVTSIGSTWFALIVTILALSIILALVMTSMGRQ